MADEAYKKFRADSTTRDVVDRAPALRIVEGRVPEPWLRVAAIAVCVPLAWLTWRVVEQPIRRSRHAMQAVVGLCAAMIAIGVAGWTLAWPVATGMLFPPMAIPEWREYDIA